MFYIRENCIPLLSLATSGELRGRNPGERVRGSSRRARPWLIRRSDALTTAYTILEDALEGEISSDAKRRALGVLIEESERATEEAHRYQEELGIRPD